MGPQPPAAHTAAAACRLDGAPCGALLPRPPGRVPRMRLPLPQVPPLRLRHLAPQCALPPLPLARTPPPALALARARDEAARRLPAAAAHRPRGLPDAPPRPPLRAAPRALRDGRPREPAGEAPLRRAADSARGWLRRGAALQPHPRTCGRRPPRDARTLPRAASRRLGRHPLARRPHACRHLRGRLHHRPRRAHPHLRAVRPPAHLRPRLCRPAARGGLRGAGARLRRRLHPGGAPPLRPLQGLALHRPPSGRERPYPQGARIREQGLRRRRGAGKTTAAAEPTAEEAAAARPANAPTPESTAEPASRPARA